jgi:hypothetical protein
LISVGIMICESESSKIVAILGMLSQTGKVRVVDRHLYCEFSFEMHWDYRDCTAECFPVPL